MQSFAGLCRYRSHGCHLDSKSTNWPLTLNELAVFFCLLCHLNIEAELLYHLDTEAELLYHLDIEAERTEAVVAADHRTHGVLHPSVVEVALASGQ